MIDGTHRELCPGLTRWENKNGATVLRLHYSADPEKTEEWVTEFAKTFPGGREGFLFRREMDIDFSSLAGKRIFPEFSRDRHVVKDFDIDPEWPKWRVIDPGYEHAFVCLWFAVDGFGTTYVYREHHQKGWLDIGRHAAQIRGLTGREKIEYTLIDPSAYATHLAAQGRTVAELLSEHEVDTVPAKRSGKKKLQFPALAELLKVGETGEPRFKVFESCKETIEEFYEYRWKQPNTPEDPDPEEPVKKRDDTIDCCGPWNWSIITRGGPRVIKSIEPGEMVWTRDGWRTVLDARCTGVRELWKVDHENGELVATPDHRVFTQRGWVRLDELIVSDTLVGCEPQNTSTKLCSTESSIDATPGTCTTGLGRRTESTAPTLSIETSGELLTEQSPLEWLFTTGTATLSTTTCRTSNSWTEASTPRCTALNGPKIDALGSDGTSPRSARSPRLGMAAPKGSRGTEGTRRKFGSVARTDGFSAKRAAPKSGRASKAGSAGAQWPAPKRTFGVAVVGNPSPTGRNEPVYNLSVEGTPEFFADGILVHNCLYYAANVDPNDEAASALRKDPHKSWYQGNRVERILAEEARRRAAFSMEDE